MSKSEQIVAAMRSRKQHNREALQDAAIDAALRSAGVAKLDRRSRERLKRAAYALLIGEMIVGRTLGEIEAGLGIGE